MFVCVYLRRAANHTNDRFLLCFGHNNTKRKAQKKKKKIIFLWLYTTTTTLCPIVVPDESARAQHVIMHSTAVCLLWRQRRDKKNVNVQVEHDKIAQIKSIYSIYRMLDGVIFSFGGGFPIYMWYSAWFSNLCVCGV